MFRPVVFTGTGSKFLNFLENSAKIRINFWVEISVQLSVCQIERTFLAIFQLNVGMGEATDFNFGQNIHRVHLIKSPLKIWRKGSMGIFRDCPNFWVPLIISGTGKVTNFKFCMHITFIKSAEQTPIKMSRKVAVDVVRDSRKFSGHPFVGCIARLSCSLGGRDRAICLLLS